MLCNIERKFMLIFFTLLPKRIACMIFSYYLFWCVFFRFDNYWYFISCLWAKQENNINYWENKCIHFFWTNILNMYSECSTRDKSMTLISILKYPRKFIFFMYFSTFFLPKNVHLHLKSPFSSWKHTQKLSSKHD